MVVEIIRNIAEYAVYSEKFNKNFLDNLIEQNVFKAFASILNMNNRLINIQLIQTTSILLQNIKAEEKKCKSYLILHLASSLTPLLSILYQTTSSPTPSSTSSSPSSSTSTMRSLWTHSSRF